MATDKEHSTQSHSDDSLNFRLLRLEAVLSATLESLTGNQEGAVQILARFLSNENPSVRWSEYIGFEVPRYGTDSDRFNPKRGGVVTNLPNLNEISERVAEHRLRIPELAEYNDVVRSIAFQHGLQSKRQDALFARQDVLDENHAMLENKQNVLTKELHEYFVVTSLGIDPNLIKLHRYLPVRVYLTTNNTETIAQVSVAVRRLLEEENCEISDQFPARQGSWFKEIWAKTREKMTQPEVQQQLVELGEKTQHAVELATIQKCQAEINRTNSEAVKNVIESMGDSDGIAQIGSVLVVKTTSRAGKSVIASRTMTTKEMIYLERHQELLMQPQKILKALSHCNDIYPDENSTLLPLPGE